MIADYQDAALLQHRYEGRTDDHIVARLDRSATVYCLAMLSYAAGEDVLTDAAWDLLSEALGDDGIALDDHAAAEAALHRLYPDFLSWVAEVTAAHDANECAAACAVSKDARA